MTATASSQPVRTAPLPTRVQRRLACEFARLRSFPLRLRMAASGPYLFLGSRVSVVNPQRMRFGNSIVLQQDVLISCGPRADLRIADLVHVSRGCVVACGEGELSIGDHTIIGEYTSIRNSNHGTAREQFIRDQDEVCQPIRIGRDVWIGRGCAVLPGVTIGDGAVVGANSVVAQDVEPYAVVAGAPARLLRYRA